MSGTHILDRVRLGTGVVTASVIGFQALEALDPLGTFVGSHLRGQVSESVATVLGIASFLALFWVVAWGVFNSVFQRWICDWIYLRCIVWIPVTRSEAKATAFLFDGSLGGWWPLVGIRKVPRQHRRLAFQVTANDIAISHQLAPPFAAVEEMRAAAEKARREAEQRAAQANTKAERQRAMEEADRSALAELGLTSLATSFEEIRNAYRRRVGQFHPDRFANAPAPVQERFKQRTQSINAAYSHLQRRFEDAA